MSFYETPGAVTEEEQKGRAPIWSVIGFGVPAVFLFLALVAGSAMPQESFGAGLTAAAICTVGFWLGVIFSGICGIVAMMRSERWILLALLDIVIPVAAFLLMLYGKL